MGDAIKERDEYIEDILQKQDKLNEDLHRVKRANSRLKNENRALKRELSDIKKEKAKERKPHYKNGKRGTKFNG